MLVAANYAVAGRISWTPGGSAIVFGRMLQAGIVGRYLDDRDIPLKAHDDRWHELDSLYRRHILDRFNC